ncbi:lysostaphin resistance A-like protein [bacterium]
MKNKNVHWKYLTVVFILSYIWQLVIYFTGDLDSKFFPLLMVFPAIVAIVFRIINKEGFRNVGWGLRKWWYIIPALIVPIGVVLGAGFLLTSLNLATLSENHFLFKDGMVEVLKIPLVLGNHLQNIAFFTLNFILSLFVQSLFGSIVTMGEEFGWRGYIQEKMIKNFGLNRGLILLGAIWGLWHLPIGLMGWNFPKLPVLGAFILTPLSTIFMGIFIGWLYLRSKSIWIPALAHAVMNLTAVLLLNELIMQQDNIILKLTFMAAWGIVAAICLISLNRKKPMLWQVSEGAAVKIQQA